LSKKISIVKVRPSTPPVISGREEEVKQEQEKKGEEEILIKSPSMTKGKRIS